MDPVDFSRIQRAVFLIDLHPLGDLQNPKLYLSSILAAARRFLSFAPLSSSIFAYKFYFSSLSPVLSTSKVHRLLGKSPTFLSFDRPAQTLDSLSRALDTLCSVADPSHFNDHGCSKALLVARSLLQLEYEYGWESLHPQDREGTLDFLVVRSNLVLLFSPASQNLDFMLEDSDLASGGEGNSISSMTSDVFLQRFVECFRLAKDRLVACDIHLSWVELSCGYECTGEVSLSGFFEKGIKELGWGFCSADAIALGSAIVPFGLIFPYVGCTMNFEEDNSLEKGNSELILEIVDVNGKPLQCKGCDLEVVDLKMDIGSSLKTFISKASKIHIKEIWMSDTERKVPSNLSRIYVIQGVSGGYKNASQNHTRGEFFADTVIALLCKEKRDFGAGQPVWQILLSFLYSRNYWAYISVSDNDDHSMEGLLMPFTLNYALLAVAKKGYLDSGKLIARKGKLTCPELTEDHRRKRSKIHQNLIQNATLSSIRELVFNHTANAVLGINLEQLYFSRKCDKSKKLKFLKCWMKQIVKSNTGSQVVADPLKEHLDVRAELKTTAASQDEPNADVIPSPTGEAYTSGSTNNDTPVFTSMEDIEAFLISIPKKIEQGLRSQEADLGILAERLVDLSSRALDMKFRGNDEVIISNEAGDVSYLKIANEVSHLLLTKPKDLILKYKSMSSASHASSTPVPDYSREYKIREHESQIFFRMELLRSSIGVNIEENMKEKMIKEICSLLQFIDINPQGDSFYRYTIVEYTERTIKNRYSNCLKDAICKIYNQMEFDLFDDEVEASDPLPKSNSEELKLDKNKENYRFCDIANGTPCNAATQQKEHQRAKTENTHERRLVKARERRIRDRRLSSFTSWMPDLQRVWAPKQPKAEKMVHDPLPKPSKSRKRHAATDDRVCETPIAGRKEHAHLEDDRSSSGISL